jgi:hypothetical protein
LNLEYLLLQLQYKGIFDPFLIFSPFFLKLFSFSQILNFKTQTAI